MLRLLAMCLLWLSCVHSGKAVNDAEDPSAMPHGMELKSESPMKMNLEEEQTLKMKRGDISISKSPCPPFYPNFGKYLPPPIFSRPYGPPTYPRNTPIPEAAHQMPMAQINYHQHIVNTHVQQPEISYVKPITPEHIYQTTQGPIVKQELYTPEPILPHKLIIDKPAVTYAPFYRKSFVQPISYTKSIIAKPLVQPITYAKTYNTEQIVQSTPCPKTVNIPVVEPVTHQKIFVPNPVIAPIAYPKSFVSSPIIEPIAHQKLFISNPTIEPVAYQKPVVTNPVFQDVRYPKTIIAKLLSLPATYLKQYESSSYHQFNKKQSVVVSPTPFCASHSPHVAAPYYYAPMHPKNRIVHIPQAMSYAPFLQPINYGSQPIVHAPQPIIHTPQPITYAPQPIIHAAQPIFHAPQPLIHAPQQFFHVAQSIVPVTVSTPVLKYADHHQDSSVVIGVKQPCDK